MIKEFKENGVAEDFPGIWAAISDLTMLLMLNGIVALADLQEIHKEITDNQWDYINDIKWYLFFNYDFSKSLQAPGVRDDEILCIIKMPTILNSHKMEIPYMSRMIAISIIRTIFTKQEKADMRELSQIPEKYRPVIKLCLDKQNDATLDEVDAIIDMTRFFNFDTNSFRKEFSK